jgi:sterol desaturase/sphingolipid hydroxylase (fatty acid hydroxylase superfamily)
MPKVAKNFEHGEAKIFNNPFLESLTKTNPITNIVVYGFSILLFSFYALMHVGLNVFLFLALFILGIISWTFAEYMLHRFVFHWVNDSKIIQRFHFIMHGSHHQFPRDKARLLMPPVPGLLMASLLFGLFYSVFYVIQIPELCFGFFPGFFSGYLLYSFVHRAIHVKRPPKRFKHIWLHHNIHHYKHPDKAFGVSNTFWDKVFGTMPPKK